MQLEQETWLESRNICCKLKAGFFQKTPQIKMFVLFLKKEVFESF